MDDNVGVWGLLACDAFEVGGYGVVVVLISEGCCPADVIIELAQLVHDMDP